MTLRTVHVPPELQPVFEQAEEVVSAFFSELRSKPEQGSIEILGERYLSIRAASLSVEFFSVVRDLLGADKRAEADDFARNILFDLAHAVGKSDARDFHAKMGLEDPVARLAAGPVYFAHTGWAFVDLSPDCVPGIDGEFYMLFDHPYSFESGAWLKAGERAEFPVCIMNAGYSSGWCEESMGVPVVSSEVLCRARGDETCRFIMAPADEIEGRVRDYIQAQPELAPRLEGHQIPGFFSRKRLEDELQRGKEELEERVERRTRELAEANQRLREEMAAREGVEQQLLQSQKLDALGRLAGGVAHDFNNILTAIRGYGDLLLSELPASDERAGYALEIARASERAANLTSQLLMFSRQRMLEPTVLDVGDVVRRMTEPLRRLIGDTVELETKTPDAPCCARLDRGRLEQVIVNLAVNARDAMPEGGLLVLEVELDSERGEVLLRFTDTGSGMDQNTLGRIFDPFFTTKPVGQGTGLGLATVYGIVQQGEGSIHVESALGRGSTFEVRFPHTDEAVEERIETPRNLGLENQGRRVLLVEDEETVRRLVRLQLERSGFEVFEACDAAEARILFEGQEGVFDLLLTDVIMPGESGVDLARDLRARRPGLQTVFISGYAEDLVTATGLRPGEEVFIQKPFTLPELEARLRELLG